MIDLFDFDFTEDVTEEKLKDHFHKIQTLFKDGRNGYFLSFEEIPNKTLPFIDDMINKGWLKNIRGNTVFGVDIPDKYLIYHTTEEIIEDFREKIYGALENAHKEDFNYYEDMLPVINACSTPIRTKNDEIDRKANIAKHEMIKDVTLKLGLKHFLEKPKSRGGKMNPINTKWAKDNVLPIIIENVQIIEDFDEMERFFNENVWFLGRLDWDKDYVSYDADIAPYPQFKQLMPSDFEIACLTQAYTSQEIELILEYSGSAFGKFEEGTEDINYVYPKEWSFQRYIQSLTKEDWEKIRSDQARLKRLHHGNFTSLWDNYLNGCPI